MNTLPLFILLFSVLALAHLFLIVTLRHKGRIILVGGFILIVTSVIAIGLISFSKPAFNFLRFYLPDPLIAVAILICSLLIGGFIMLQSDLVHRPWSRGRGSDFPLSMERYRNVKKLATGGVGTIWYAERASDNTPVIVKVPVEDDEKTGMSFLQELTLQKELDHPNIVRIFAVNILPVPYIEMEYIPGTLADLKKPLSITRAVQIISGIGSALAYAHSRGIIHGDLKPANILMGADEVPKITDWGLSRTVTSRWSVPGFSPRYAAPEQRKSGGQCSMATDVWQTGLILTELLTGNAEVPSGSEPVFSMSGGPVLLHVINRCLAFEPNNRYQNGVEFIDAFSNWTEEV